MAPTSITVGVLALQGGVVEHLNVLRKAAKHMTSSSPLKPLEFTFTEVRTADQLAQCNALVIPGGESTTMAIVARRRGLLDPLREFVKIQHKPVWGTCAGLVLLSEQASGTMQGGQELVGGLDVRVLRNRFGSQLQSFIAELELNFLNDLSAQDSAGRQGPFKAVFIRAPVVEEILSDGGDAKAKAPVQVLGVYQPKGRQDRDIVAVRQGNVFGTSFHPELTDDMRVHIWWLRQVVEAVGHERLAGNGV
ncbi:hypothetical protein VTI74DRAFT_8699 [Chaetomium olivicolor]